MEKTRPPRPAGDAALQLLLSAFAATLQAGRSVAEVLGGILGLSEHLIQADAFAVWRASDDRKTWRALATKGLFPAPPHNRAGRWSAAAAVQDRGHS